MFRELTIHENVDILLTPCDSNIGRKNILTADCTSVTLSTDLIVFSWFSLCDPQGIKILCYSPECTSNSCATWPTLASTLPICQLAQPLPPIVFVLSFAFVFEFEFVFVYAFVQPASTLPRCQLAHSLPPIGQTNNQLCCTCWEPDQPNFRPHPCFTCGFVWIVSFFEFELEELPNSVLTRRTRIVGAQWKTDVLTLFVYVFVFTLVFVLTHRTRCVRNLRQHVAPAAIYAAA